ncbi:hypothetical protein Ga0061067_102280 [Pannonibacter indicus]|uniref:Uncharacterized protein n=1 Tax=Pannonibacter indicus TaxID=466044 RepID=A0A0K6HQL9_9HYPH|nr:hypothetical protein Ga0061067_102280 [Pannonibacter indicus]
MAEICERPLRAMKKGTPFEGALDGKIVFCGDQVTAALDVSRDS